MGSIHQLVFGGIRPSIEAKALDPRNGVTAHNTRLRNMSLQAERAPLPINTFAPTIVRTIFKVPDGGECCGPLMVWDHCVSVLPAPNPGNCVDWTQVIIFHQCGRGAPERYFKCEDAYYPLEVPPPNRPLRLTLVTPGTLQNAPNTGPDQRAYTYTWVDRFGIESPPAPPSLTVQSYDDQTWQLTGFDAPPANAVAMRIYRASSFFEDGQQVANPMNTSFQLVQEIDALPAINVYNDNRTLSQLDYGTLQTFDQCPVPCMEQVVVTESGYYVGWKENVIYISEKNEPHNWPEKYRMTIPDKIVGIAQFYDTIFVGTTGRPYRFNVTFKAMGDEADAEAVPLPYAEKFPLRSRFCLVPTNFGAMYTCPRGVVLLQAQGSAVLDSRSRIDEEKWNDFVPNVAAYHKGKFYGSRMPAGVAFVYDVQEPSEGEPDLGDLMTMDWNPTAAHAADDGFLYYSIGSDVFAWGEGVTRLPYVWRSKVFRMPGLMAFSAAKVVGEYGTPVTFNLYADGVLYHSQPVASSQPFRLPRNGKAIDWQFEVSGVTTVTEVHIATSIVELTEERQ